jgi:hypothetical protein
LRGSSGWFMRLRHGGSLKEAWDSLSFKLEAIKEKLPERRTKELKELVEATVTSAEDMDQWVTKNLAALNAIQHRMLADHKPGIENLGEFLKEMIDALNGTERLLDVTIEGDLSSVVGHFLPCDPLIVVDAIHCIIRNAIEAACRVPQDVLEIRIDTRSGLSRSPLFDEIVTIEISNSGPPILPEIADCLFLDGFHHDANETAAEADNADLKRKGRGLAVARAQLSYYHGDLQLVRPGREDPAPETLEEQAGFTPTTETGPAFALRFGVPRRFDEPPGGVIDATTDAGL